MDCQQAPFCMTQVLRHFSLDAKLGLSEVQVHEVRCYTQSPLDIISDARIPVLIMLVLFTPPIQLACLSVERPQLQARAIYGNNELSAEKGKGQGSCPCRQEQQLGKFEHARMIGCRVDTCASQADQSALMECWL